MPIVQNLIAPKKVEQIDRLLDTLFEKEDWMKATPEEVERFIQRIREIGEI